MKYIALFFLILFLSCTAENKQLYSVTEKTWDESLGNHRAMLQIDQAGDAVSVDILWRRHDNDPDKKQFIIIHESGEVVKNIHRVLVDNERCQLAFGPVEKTGKYFFCYLPFVIQKGYGFVYTYLQHIIDDAQKERQV